MLVLNRYFYLFLIWVHTSVCFNTMPLRTHKANGLFFYYININKAPPSRVNITLAEATPTQPCHFISDNKISSCKLFAKNFISDNKFSSCKLFAKILTARKNVFIEFLSTSINYHRHWTTLD